MDKVLKIIIIDDDLDDQVLMKQAFESANTTANVEFVTRSDDALHLLEGYGKAEMPDIIVSDYNMPMMNGEEFLKRLALMEQYANVPRVIVSTAASPSIIESCIANGASKYLLKPSDFEDLVKLAHSIIALAGK